MELEWKTCAVGVLETGSESVAENPFDLDVQLPDYMPDIHRILHCAVTPQIQSIQTAGERIAAEGTGQMRVLYCSEDGSAHVWEQSFPIRRTAPETLRNGDMSVFASTEYVNCRASGQRRCTVNGSVSIRFRTVSRKEIPIPTASDNAGLQMQTEPLQALSMTSCAEKSFVMSEVAELKDEAPIGGILFTRTILRVDSTKAVQDKILVKGEAVTQAQYLSATDGNSIGSFTHSMPVNQVLEAVGVSDTDSLDVSLRVLSSMSVPKADGNGENRLLEITLQIAASVRCFAQIGTQTIRDAYSTKETLVPQYGELELLSGCSRWQDTIHVHEKVDAAGSGLQTVMTACVQDIQSDCVTRDGMALVQCTVVLGVLGRNAEGALIWAEKPFSFVCRKALDTDAGIFACNPNVCLTKCTASAADDGMLDVQAEGFIDGMLYTGNMIRCLTSATVEPFAADQDPAALTIYFADAGERVWDIARRYRTTVHAVSQENELSEDAVPERRMLIIPSA